jgi:hypothetical protein
VDIDSTTATTYSVSGITQYQAQNLLQIAIKNGSDMLDDDEKETLNSLRQALLNAGVIAKRGEANAG